MADTSLRLSGVAGELARRGHGGAAIRLVTEWGGSKRSIPVNPQPGNPLVEIVGMEAARVLADLCGGVRVDIASKAALEDTLKADIVRLAEQGLGTRNIAGQLGCTERYVRKVVNSSADGTRKKGRSRKAPDERQMDIEVFLSLL